MFMRGVNVGDASEKWQCMLHDLKLDKQEADGWRLAEMSRSV